MDYKTCLLKLNMLEKLNDEIEEVLIMFTTAVNFEDADIEREAGEAAAILQQVRRGIISDLFDEIWAAAMMEKEEKKSMHDKYIRVKMASMINFFDSLENKEADFYSALEKIEGKNILTVDDAGTFAGKLIISQIAQIQKQKKEILNTVVTMNEIPGLEIV